jgi:hypothetical protein
MEIRLVNDKATLDGLVSLAAYINDEGLAVDLAAELHALEELIRQLMHARAVSAWAKS